MSNQPVCKILSYLSIVLEKLE